MRSHPFLSSILFFLALIGLPATYAVDPEPYTLPISFSFRIAGASSATLTVYGEGSSPTVSASTGGSVTESDAQAARLRPGQAYVLNFQASGATSYWLSLVAPSGYQCFVNGVPRDLIAQTPGGGTHSDDYTIELRPVTGAGFLEAGIFTGIELGQAVSWELGAGGLRSGHSVGRVAFRELDLSNSPASRARLVYVPPINTWQINAVRDGGSAQTLRQIASPRKILDFVDDGSGGYWVKYYDYDDAAQPYTGGVYVFDGSDVPWRTIHVESPAANQLKMTETEGSAVRVSHLSLTSGTVASGTYAWQLQEGDATTWLRTTTHASSLSGGVRENTVTVRTGGTSGTIVSETKYVYHTYGWGEDLYQVIVNPNGGGQALTTTYTYYETAPGSGSETYRGNYRRVKAITGPTGAWTAYEYYDDWDVRGQTKYQYQPYLDAPSTFSLDPTLGGVKYFEYAADATGRYRRPSLVQEKIGNVPAGKTVWTYDNAADSGPLRVKADVKSYFGSGSSDYVQTRTESIDFLSGDIDESGEPVVVKNPDLSQTSWSRSGGGYNPSTHVFTVSGDFYWRELKLQGSTSSSGAESQSSYDSQSFPAIYLVPYKSTLEILIRSVAGYVLRTETRVYTGSGTWSAVLSATDSTYNVQCRPTASTVSNGATTTYAYTGGRVSSVTGADGVETQYTYDALGRTATVKKIGASASGIHAAQADATTTYAYDGAGRVLTEIRSATGTSETIVSSAAYDLAGRQTSATPPGLSATTVSYNASARTQTTTAPDGGTVIQTTYLDGRTKQVEGTATVAQYLTYAVESDGRQRTQLNTGTSSSARLQKSWIDWLGRGLKTERPGFSQSSQAAFIEERFYSGTTGQLTKTTATGSAPMLYVYNTLGQMTRSGLDVDNGGALVLASSDRITDADTVFESYSSAWWLKTTTTAYPFASSSTAVTSSLTRQRLTGHTSGRLSETQATDAEGNTTTSTTDLSGKLITTTTTVPGITNPRTDFAYNGLPSTATGHDSLTAKQQYDALGRPWKVTDARSLVTTTAYVTGTTRVSTVTDSAGAVSTVSYTTAGRTDWAQDALGHVSRYAYNLRGQVTNQWGSGTIPVSSSYDSTYGDRIGMSTYRGAPAADYVSWPTSSIGTADTTTWTFDTASGLLWKKTDAAGKYVAFNYNARGQVATRTWARGTTTTYAYDSATAELTGQTYSDSTPAVSYTYTRLGQTDAVTDFTGTRDYVYDSSKPWRLQNETLPSDFGSVSFTARYEATGLVGRYAGFKLGSAPASSSIVEQDYAYTAAGRFDALTSQRASNSVSATFQYGYTTNTALVNGYTTGSNFAVARTYESNRDVLASLDSKWSTTSLTKYEFTTDALYQRKTAKQSGTAFTDYYASGYSSVFNQYTYNARGELETAAMYRGDTTPAVNAAPSATDELPGRRFEYRYDGAGNRKNAGPTGSPANIDEQYTTNALNQYIAKENNSVRVTGTAAADAKVAVAGSTIVNRRDRVWSTELFPLNTSSAVAGNVTVYTAPVAADRIKTDSSKTFFIPKAAQTFTYDDDGNLTADSVWDYTYDAENRLIAMQHRSEVIGTGKIATTDARRLEFKYDYLGRRVAKIVKGGWNGSSYPTTLSHGKFLYDGWNLVAEYTGATSTTLGTLVRAYTWGLDLAGTLTATGGVGALVQLYDAGTTKTYLPTYDGNGNVVSMVNASSGVLEAVYEYDPFGNLLRSEGAYVGTNPIRFSSKYTDLESGLSYYGHRYYSATLGRFINRDPIEEAGGLNLYGFCGNDGVNRWDMLGMDSPVLMAPYVVPGSGVTVDREISDPDENGFAIVTEWENGDYGRNFLSTYTIFVGRPNNSSPDESDPGTGNEFVQPNPAFNGLVQQVLTENQGRITIGNPVVGDKPTAPNKTASDYDFVNGVKVIGANRGLPVGQMGIGSLSDARDVLYSLGQDPTQSWPKQRAVYAIRALDNPSEVKKHALIGGVGSLGMNLILGAATPGFRSGIAGGFTADAVTTTSQARLTTVLGSMADVGPYSVRDGFNTLVIGNWKYLGANAVDAINTTWLNAAVQRGDEIWLMTNPAKHGQLMLDLGKQSRYLDLELPLLKQTGAPAVIKY